jgi:hypothetical protein
METAGSTPRRAGGQRWRGTSKEYRQAVIAQLNRIRRNRAEARKLDKAIAYVQAAGYTVQAPLEKAS